MAVLERADQLAVLVDQFDHVGSSGRLVLISGEAGAGKSVLVREFLDRHAEGAQVLVGRCDDLFASRPLGPLADMARDRPGPLADALASGTQAATFEAFLAELATPGAPVVVVFEDVQWADEATFDLLRLLARRLDALPCLILATHRDNLATDHPLRRVAGSLLGPQVRRVHVPPLSVDAVRALVGAYPIDPVELHSRTGGNPFFVAEVLAGEPGVVPGTVRDAVLARAACLSDTARDALDAVAVLGRSVGPELIQAVADCGTDAIDECVTAHLLVDEDGRQAFRHDLSRQAVEQAMTPLRRRRLHARALRFLGPDADPVQAAHHAIGAGDGDAIADVAARAAEECVALGAHTQAAALYARALAHADRVAPDVRLNLLVAAAETFAKVERMDDAIGAGERALALLEGAGDDAALGQCEARLTSRYLWAGRGEDAADAARRALDSAGRMEESSAQLEILNRVSGFQMCTGDFDAAIATALHALAVAERLGLEHRAVAAMNNYGATLCVSDPARGIDVLRSALGRAKQAGVIVEIVRVGANLAESLINACEPAAALPVIDDAISVAEEHEERFHLSSLAGLRAGAALLLGRWDQAISDLTPVLADDRASAVTRTVALRHLGRIRARRGDPGAFEALNESLALATATTEAQVVAPARIASAEAAWLAGDLALAAVHLDAALALADRLEPCYLRDLAHWARRTGSEWAPDGCTVEPMPQILAGDARGVATFWDAHDCPYEAADALCDSADVQDLRDAHERLLALGARPRAQLVARRLRDLGVRAVSRGPRATTRANAAGLTAQELVVAGLLVEGLTNRAIADRLVLSQKTVGHHVSAVLSKLGVGSRRQVAEAARAVGLTLDDSSPSGHS